MTPKHRGRLGKHIHRVNQAPDLRLQALRGGGALLNQRGILLGDGIHLSDGLAGFQNAIALLLGGGADVGNQGGNLLHLLHDGLYLRLRAGHQGAAGLHLVNTGADQYLDFLGGRGAALR